MHTAIIIVVVVVVFVVVVVAVIIVFRFFYCHILYIYIASICTFILYPFIQSFIRSFIHSFIHAFIVSFQHLFIRSCRNPQLKSLYREWMCFCFCFSFFFSFFFTVFICNRMVNKSSKSLNVLLKLLQVDTSATWNKKKIKTTPTKNRKINETRLQQKIFFNLIKNDLFFSIFMPPSKWGVYVSNVCFEKFLKFSCSQRLR